MWQVLDTAVNESDTSLRDCCHGSNLNAEWVHMNTLLKINKTNKEINYGSGFSPAQ